MGGRIPSAPCRPPHTKTNTARSADTAKPILNTSLPSSVRRSLIRKANSSITQQSHTIQCYQGMTQIVLNIENLSAAQAIRALVKNMIGVKIVSETKTSVKRSRTRPHLPHQQQPKAGKDDTGRSAATSYRRRHAQRTLKLSLLLTGKRQVKRSQSNNVYCGCIGRRRRDLPS